MKLLRKIIGVLLLLVSVTVLVGKLHADETPTWPTPVPGPPVPPPPIDGH